jgi:hypothetical protein
LWLRGRGHVGRHLNRRVANSRRRSRIEHQGSDIHWGAPSTAHITRYFTVKYHLPSGTVALSGGVVKPIRTEPNRLYKLENSA